MCEQKVLFTKFEFKFFLRTYFETKYNLQATKIIYVKQINILSKIVEKKILKQGIKNNFDVKKFIKRQ
jgi:hypothetical protein